MSDIVVRPYGDSNGRDLGTYWSWKPSGPITRIELVGSEYLVHTIRFKSNDIYSPTYGESNYPLQEQKQFNIDIEGPSEYLVSISGAYGHWDSNKSRYFEWLLFETNLGNVHGPWPQPFYFNGKYPRPSRLPMVPFSYRTPNATPILGFHGFTDTVYLPYVNAIGVFVKPIHLSPAPTPSPTVTPPIFVREWGISNEKSWKFQPSGDINQIVIFHSKVVHSLMFKSKDDEVSEKIGGHGGIKSTVHIEKGVSLTGIKGTYSNLLTSLSFCTSDGKVHGPCGKEFGTEFSFSADGSIVGFHGHSGALVNAIGVYVKPSTSSLA